MSQPEFEDRQSDDAGPESRPEPDDTGGNLFERYGTATPREPSEPERSEADFAERLGGVLASAGARTGRRLAAVRQLPGRLAGTVRERLDARSRRRRDSEGVAKGRGGPGLGGPPRWPGAVAAGLVGVAGATLAFVVLSTLILGGDGGSEERSGEAHATRERGADDRGSRRTAETRWAIDRREQRRANQRRDRRRGSKRRHRSDTGDRGEPAAASGPVGAPPAPPPAPAATPSVAPAAPASPPPAPAPAPAPPAGDPADIQFGIEG